QPIIEPATFIGKLLPAVTEELNIAPLDVIAAASHDTASAVIAVPVQTSADWAYLSSGTWSLLGMEIEQPIITPESLRHNFTNEGGVNNSIRFLRNTMGLWLLQRCMAQWSESGEAIDYSQLADLVSSAQPFQSLINPDDITFLNPPDMAAAIQEFCRQHKQPIPTTKGEIIRCILESLALKYRYICDLMNELRPAPLKRLHIVGGGSQNELLNQFTANATGLEVIAGPSEATALGNIMVQAIATRELSSIQEGRELIAQSFQLNHFQPTERDCWEQAYQRAKPLFIT
ncbi:MAG: FGGY-family carbohydrate kinase, partial [bacterium]|nr:FGGY-family carbohydrate kinase [bacterium]